MKSIIFMIFMKTMVFEIPGSPNLGVTHRRTLGDSDTLPGGIAEIARRDRGDPNVPQNYWFEQHLSADPVRSPASPQVLRGSAISGTVLNIPVRGSRLLRRLDSEYVLLISRMHGF